jgi:hypothetical protein
MYVFMWIENSSNWTNELGLSVSALFNLFINVQKPLNQQHLHSVQVVDKRIIHVYAGKW